MPILFLNFDFYCNYRKIYDFTYTGDVHKKLYMLHI